MDAPQRRASAKRPCRSVAKVCTPQSGSPAQRDSVGRRQEPHLISAIKSDQVGDAQVHRVEKIVQIPIGCPLFTSIKLRLGQ